MSLQQCRVYLSTPKPVMLPAMADASDSSDSSIRRRRFQFRLRTLMIGVIALVAIGLLAWDIQAVVRQRLKLREIRGYGGSYSGDPRFSEKTRYEPPIYRRILGDSPITIIWLPSRRNHIYSNAEEKDIAEMFPGAVIAHIEEPALEIIRQ